MVLKKWNLSVLCVVAFLFSACNKSDEYDPQASSSNPVSFTSSIDRDQNSRASGATWGKDNIGVFMVEAGEQLSDVSVLARNKKHVTLGDGLFTSASVSEAIYYPKDDLGVNFIAYYPYQTDITDYIYPIDLSNQQSQEAIDLLYSPANGTFSFNSPDAAFRFKHQLTKLVFEVSPSAEGESLQGLTTVIKGMKSAGTFNLSTGELAADNGSVKDIAFNVSASTNGQYIAEALLLPGESLSDVRVTFSLPSGSKVWRIPNGTKFDGGKQYTYQVTLEGGEGEPEPEPVGWFETPTIAPLADVMYVKHFLPENDRKHIRNYSLLYDTKYKLAYWVAYPMHSYYLGDAKRTDAWAYDPQINEVWQPDLSSSYPPKDLDRGHQLASADRTYSKEGNKTTFYYSNMTAQNSSLNQGVWASLEKKVRDWVDDCDTLYVVTGAMVTTKTDQSVEYVNDKSGKAIAVPKCYYKALAQKRGEKYYTIAYKMNNEKPANAYDNYRLTVARLEEETGFTFFPQLKGNEKSTIDDSVWK